MSKKILSFLKRPGVSLRAISLQRMDITVFLFAVFVLFVKAGWANPGAEPDYRTSLVRLQVLKQPTNMTNPWQKKKTSSEQYLGVYIGGKHLLTTALAIRDSSFLEMSRFGESATYSVKVDFVDEEANLALLHVNHENALFGMVPLPLAPDLPLQTVVSILKPYDLFTLRVVPARLIKVDALLPTTSGYPLLTYLLEAEQEGFGAAEPVVSNGYLVALASHQETKTLVASLPSGVLSHFLEDCQPLFLKEQEAQPVPESIKGRGEIPFQASTFYRGFPALGILTEPLLDPKLRGFLGVDHEPGGARIERVFEDSPFFGKILPNDVLLQVNNTLLDRYGYYTHPLWGQVPISVLLNQMYAGEPVELTFVRKGRLFRLQATLARHDSTHFVVPFYRKNQKEPFFIFGGLLFQELSIPYLNQLSKSWAHEARLQFSYPTLYQTESTRDGRKRIIVLTKVLSDPFNQGYVGTGGSTVEKVNGQKIDSLESLKNALAHPVKAANGKDFAVVTLKFGEGEIILSYDHLEEIHRRIASTYQIFDKESFFNTPLVSEK